MPSCLKLPILSFMKFFHQQFAGAPATENEKAQLTGVSGGKKADLQALGKAECVAGY